MQVKKIMTKKVIFVKPSNKVVEVADLLTAHRIHGVPVVDKGKVVGIITETDFFVKDVPNLFIPSYIDFLKQSKFAHKVSKKKKQEMDKLLDAKAEDIMTKNCFTVRENMEVSELIKIFKEKKLFTFPVVNKAQKIVGVITQADIIKLIKI